jgi:hypothetical protein
MKTRSLLSLATLAILATGASACNNRLLVGDPDGGPPINTTGTAGTTGLGTGASGSTGAPMTGAAGQSAPVTGVAGQPVMTGSGGSGPPTTTKTVTPLRISGEEAVTRLADVIWKAPPSDDLLSQAHLGHFKTTDDLYGAIRQLLADPRARKGIGAFYRYWLQLDKLAAIERDPQVFPTFTHQLAVDMADATEAFAVDVTLSAGGTYWTLMTAPQGYANEALAAVYGLSGITGSALRPVALDPMQRSGLITQPALLAMSTFKHRNSPTQRGTYFVPTFLCTQIPPPPAGIGNPPLDPIAPATTVRQALQQSVSQSASCAACHNLIDPAGLALETFDAIGRWRTTDNGLPIDMSGIKVLNLTDTGEPSVIDSPTTLANNMGKSHHVQECFAKYWLGWVTGGQAFDDQQVASVLAVVRAAGFDLKELIAAVLTTDQFLAPR